MLGGQGGLHLLVLDDPAARGVGQEDPAGLQPAFADHRGRVDVQHADLAGQHDQAVAGDPVPAGAQSVPVQHRPDRGAVGERDQGGPVPWLHQRGVEPVEGPAGRVHPGVVLPRLRDHHQHRVRQRPPAQVQQFQAGVEAGRVARGLAEHRQQALDSPPAGIRPDQAGGQARLPGPHPVAVAPDRVDLAVVRDEPVRMGQWPGGQRVGGEPGVHQREGGCVLRIGQVRVELLKLGRGEHPLVHDRRRRQAGEVRAGLGLGLLAQAERPPVERQPPLAGGGADEHLGQPRHRRPRAVAAAARVMRNVTPAEHGQVLPGGDALDRRDGGGRAAAVIAVRRQEHHPGRIGTRRRQRELAGGTEEGVRDLGGDARAVAGVRVAALRAPVLQVAQHGQRAGHDVMAAAAG